MLHMCKHEPNKKETNDGGMWCDTFIAGVSEGNGKW